MSKKASSTKQVHVRTADGNIAVYGDRDMARAGILSGFAESGVNEVEQVWEEDEDGNVTDLGLSWKVSLEEL